MYELAQFLSSLLCYCEYDVVYILGVIRHAVQGVTRGITPIIVYRYLIHCDTGTGAL